MLGLNPEQVLQMLKAKFPAGVEFFTIKGGYVGDELRFPNASTIFIRVGTMSQTA